MAESDINLLLLKRIASGDEAALEALVEKNMGLVKSIALRFKDRGTEYEDLVQIGALGMIKAARNFDFSFGTVFSTYAVPLIAGEIKRFLRDEGPIKVSRTIKKLANDALRTREEFVLNENREPHLSELAAILSCSEEELATALDAGAPVRSIFETSGNEEGQLLDFLADKENPIETLTDRLALKEAIDTLEERHQQIVYLRFYKELSQEEIGRVLGLSQVKVSREEKKIIKQLKKCL